MGYRAQFDRRLAALATGIFEEFEDLPVVTVVQALTTARHLLCQQGQGPLTPEAVAAEARALLRADSRPLLPNENGPDRYGTDRW